MSDHAKDSKPTVVRLNNDVPRALRNESREMAFVMGTTFAAYITAAIATYNQIQRAKLVEKFSGQEQDITSLIVLPDEVADEVSAGRAHTTMSDDDSDDDAAEDATDYNGYGDNQ